MSEPLDQLEKTLDYSFSDQKLLEQALTHRSADSVNNERLEYLGDAILGFLIADILFRELSDVAEGALTRKRASLVKKETLASLARQLKLGDFIQLGTGERKSGGWRRDSILSNTLEAVIGAIYLDGGIDVCSTFVNSIYKDLLRAPQLQESTKDSKTELQEYLQARKLPLPQYRVIAEEGEAHKRIFSVECRIQPLEQAVVANGRSKRIAEQQAAMKALTLVQQQS